MLKHAVVGNDPRHKVRQSSLHPDLLPALARLIRRGAEKAQIVVVSHNPVLVAALRSAPDVQILGLKKVTGETVVDGLGLLDKPSWNWAT